MSSSDSQIDKWKKKYYRSLDEIEALEILNKKNDTICCRALTRLSLAAKGFNSELDPHLLRLRNQLKKGIIDLQLQKEIEQFSEALLRFEAGNADEPLQDASLLFDFLVAHETSKEKIKALNLLRGQYEAGKIASAKELLSLVTQLCSPDTIELDHEPAAITGLGANLDIQFISEQLISLIEDLDMPNTSVADAKKIVAALKAEQTEETFQKNVDAALALLQTIKEHDQREKKEMEVFLAHVTEQLSALGGSTHSLNEASQQVILKRNNLDQTVSRQMQALQVNSENATKLEPLKALVKKELENITEKIKTHQQAEKQQQKRDTLKFAQMADKIEAMKSETQALKESLKKANTEAITDPLTKLPNRMAYDRRFEAELARWRRNKTPLSLLMWDIDFFKKINDTYGHKAGDKTLMIIAKLLNKYCRETDFVSRFGGEEFTMLLSDTDKKSAFILAEKIRKIIAKTGFNSAGSAINITISCGITDLREGDTQESLFERADQALYKAKQNGRNQCVIN